MKMGTLYFPNLDLSFEINPTFQIGPITIAWYGVLIAVGFLLAFIYCYRNIKKFGLTQNDFLDVLIGAVIGGIIGARLYYVAFEWDYYSQDLTKIFDIRSGGLAIYGGIIAAFIVALVICRIKKIRFLPFADLAVGGLFIGQAIGRWGNFINMEAFGTNTELPWGMTSAKIQTYLSTHLEELTANGMQIDPMSPVHPTFLYESLVCIIGFIVILFLTKRRRFDGELLLFYSAWYGIGRCLIEGLRTDSLMLGPIRISQLLAGVFAVTAIVIWIVVRVKIHKKNDPEYLKLYVYTEESARRIALDNQKKKGKKGQDDSENSQEESFTDTQPENTGAEDSIDQEDIQQNEASVEKQLSGESSKQTEDEDTVKQEPDNISDDTIQSEKNEEDK